MFEILLAAVITATGSNVDPNRLTINDPIPRQYQGSATITVMTVDKQSIVDSFCGNKDTDKYTVYGCVLENGTILVLNPCLREKEMKDKKSFATLICHEKAHHNGWVHKKNFSK